MHELVGLSCAKQTTVLHPSESLLVAVAADGCVKAADLRTSRPIFSLKRKSPATALGFSPLGDRLFVGNQGGIIEELEFWRLVEGKVPQLKERAPAFDEQAANRLVNYKVDRAAASLVGLEKDLGVGSANKKICGRLSSHDALVGSLVRKMV